jgi:hypothetical protein
MARTVCLVFLISMLVAATKKIKKIKKVALVAGTQQNSSNLFLKISMAAHYMVMFALQKVA